MSRGSETEGLLNNSFSSDSNNDEEIKADNAETNTFTEKKTKAKANRVKDAFKNVSPQEMEDLREKLKEGYFESYFSWTFWNTLHSNHGSTLGYAFGFLLILFLNYEWMLEEFADSTEGHSVAKTFVILFVIFSYSFITMGLELLQLTIVLLEIYFPLYCRKIQKCFINVINMSEKLKKMRTSKYFCTPAVIIWCLCFALTGSILWKWFWWNHICKSYHDRSCRGSWLGKMVIKYRDEACYDGTASSMICERFVSYLPIMLFSVFMVFIGNVFVPLLNDCLSVYYPLSQKLEAAFDIIDRLDETNRPEESRIAYSEHGKRCSPCLNKDVPPILHQSRGEVGMSYAKKIIPTVTGVCLLLLLDWIIVKKFFPK